MAIERKGHSHPVVKAGVIGIAVALTAVLVMSAVSIVIGTIWAIIKIALLIALVAGIVHLGRSRSRLP